MLNYFPAGLLFWLFSYIFKENNSPDSKVKCVNNPKKESFPKKHVQYISNGRLLSDTLFFYYYDMLRLTDKKQVTDKTIIKYADRRYSLINKIEYDANWPIAARDVKAAKVYVLDRWYYMTNLN